MNKQSFIPERDGFCGAWYPLPQTEKTDCAIILMLGDSSEDRMAASGAKWLHRQGCHALAMSADRKDYGHHNYPVERFGRPLPGPAPARGHRIPESPGLQEDWDRWRVHYGDAGARSRIVLSGNQPDSRCLPAGLHYGGLLSGRKGRHARTAGRK